MKDKEIIKLKKNISNLLLENNQKVLFVFDFDGTLVDSFNSVLVPVLKSIGVEIGTYCEFSNRNGSFKKYVGNKGHRLHNLRTYKKIDKHEFQKVLMKTYLLESKKLQEIFYLVKSLENIPNIEFGVVSRNYISNYFHPEKIIETVLTKLNYFNNPLSFVKRIDPRKKKTKCFQYIKSDYPKHIICSMGDEIGDYISAVSAKFDCVFPIEGYDSTDLFEKQDIFPIITEKIEYVVFSSLEKRIKEIYEIEEKISPFAEELA